MNLGEATRRWRTRRCAWLLLPLLLLLPWGLLGACGRRASPPRAIRVAPPPDGAAAAVAALFPSCRVPAAMPCDVRDAACQRDLFALMSCLSGASGAVRPPVRFVSEAEARRPPTSLVPDSLQRAVRRLGLAILDDRAEPRAPGIGPNAFYAPREGVVFFVAREAVPPDGALAAFVLGHEYVHAIQDARHALRDVRDSRDRRTFDEELALWSAIEGEATLYEEGMRALVYGRAPRSWLAGRFATQTAASDQAIVRQRRPLEASFATFPYSYGASWALATRPASAASPPLWLAAPPSSRAVMVERHGWPAVLERQRCPDDSPTSLGPGWRRRARDSLGAWLVQTYVGKRTRDLERARGAARDWRGDWLSIYEGQQGPAAAARGQARPASGGGLIWRTCWASAAAAAEMRQLIEDQLREDPKAPSAVASLDNDVVAVALDPDARAATSPALILRGLGFSQPR